MNVSDLKLEIFRQIDSLDKDRLEEIYGVLVNFLHSKNDFEDWEKLTKEQQQGITNAIEEIDKGKGIAHQTVMDNIRKKYTNV
ncbi:MAG TPA: hypothetical protein VK205_04055 [Prolixibacteraceae bacterium]|nr:hypothetical protein [Prolixibacteraceae bacterium]